MRTIPEALIRKIPYQERLKWYHVEKEVLIREDLARPADELDEKLKDLARKWRV